MRYKGTKEVEVSNYEVIDVVFLYDYGSIEILKLMWREVDVLPLLEDWGKDRRLKIYLWKLESNN
jgi:hypothetical protein